MTESAGEPDVPSTSSVVVPEHVVHRRFATETVLLNLQTGQYHGVNPTGGRMLELLEGGATVGDAAAQLADEFERPQDEMEQDLRAFCSDLAQRGLIEVHGSQSD